MEITSQDILPILLWPLILLNIFGLYAGFGILSFILTSKLLLKKTYPKKLFVVAYTFIGLGFLAKIFVIID